MADLIESITVEASPSDPYTLVSNLPRMREWSPECTRVTWTSHPPTPPGTPAGTSEADAPGAAGSPGPLRLLFRPFFGNRTPRNAHGIHTTLTRLKSTAGATATA
jgi:hypothetical protein